MSRSDKYQYKFKEVLVPSWALDGLPAPKVNSEAFYNLQSQLFNTVLKVCLNNLSRDHFLLLINLAYKEKDIDVCAVIGKKPSNYSIMKKRLLKRVKILCKSNDEILKLFKEMNEE